VDRAEFSLFSGSIIDPEVIGQSGTRSLRRIERSRRNRYFRLVTERPFGLRDAAVCLAAGLWPEAMQRQVGCIKPGGRHRCAFGLARFRFTEGGLPADGKESLGLCRTRRAWWGADVRAIGGNNVNAASDGDPPLGGFCACDFDQKVRSRMVVLAAQAVCVIEDRRDVAGIGFLPERLEGRALLLRDEISIERNLCMGGSCKNDREREGAGDLRVEPLHYSPLRSERMAPDRSRLLCRPTVKDCSPRVAPIA